MNYKVTALLLDEAPSIPGAAEIFLCPYLLEHKKLMQGRDRPLWSPVPVRDQVPVEAA